MSKPYWTPEGSGKRATGPQQAFLRDLLREAEARGIKSAVSTPRSKVSSLTVATASWAITTLKGELGR